MMEVAKEDLEGVVKAARLNQVDKVVGACEALLEKFRGDEVLLRTKCVGLAKKGRVGEARTIARELGLGDEEAYCAYRLEAFDEALALAGTTPLGAHVAAQALYKKGDPKAEDAYARLMAEEPRPAIATNYLAATTSGGNLYESYVAAVEPKHYEVAFNASVAFLARGDPRRALSLLSRIEEVVGGSDALLVSVQIAACEASLGIGGSIQRCKAILSALESKSTAKSRAVACCAAHALYAARKRGDELFDSHKRLRPFADRRAAVPLTPVQRRVAALNWGCLLVDMGKTNAAKDVLSGLLEECPGGAIRADAILLMAHCEALKKKKKKEKKAEKISSSDEEGTDVERLTARCARAQLCVDSGDLKGAAALLADLRDPAAISATACLLEAAGDSEDALKALDAAPPSRNLAAHRLRLGDVDGAADVLEKLDDVQRAAALVASWRDVDLAESLVLTLQLPEVSDDDNVVVVDAEALLAEPLVRSSQQQQQQHSQQHSQQQHFSAALETEETSKDVAALETTTAAAALRRSQRRRDKRREAYLAKLAERGDYDPKNPSKPDPERWIPKKLRSYNQKRRKNRGGKFSGAQGGGESKDAAKLDVAAKVKAAAAAAAAASEQSSNGHNAPPPRKGQRKGGGGPKKRGGG